MSKRRSKDTFDKIIVIIIIMALVLSMVILAPGIMVASLFNAVFQLEILALWIITIIATIIIIITIQIKAKEAWTKFYLTLAIAMFVVGCIITHINNDNLFFNTIKNMYPILFSINS